MNDDKVLNKEQLEAIQYGGGPLLIIAGAGTGKTTVVTERIKWLITKGLAKPSEILALTFTDKAAREMEERVDIAMPYGYTQMWIMTFHSFGDRILRDEALHIGLDPRYKLMSDAETFIFIKKNFWKFDINYFRPSGNPYKFIEGMIQHFSRLKDEDISPEEYLKYAQDLNKRTATQRHKKDKDTKTQKLSDLKFPPKAEFSDFVLQEKYSEIVDDEFKKTLELAKAYKTYEDLKIKEGVMDFGDLITNTLKLFRTRKNVLREYQKQFKYILVDEFQDTNISQNELVILLAGEKQNLTVVCDDDQSIYKWRGAAISNILQFKDRFPEAKIVSLTKNYRSTQEILNKAYLLIQNNNPDRLEVKAKIDKKLSSMRKIKGEKIEFIHADRVENEAEAIADNIKHLTDNNYQFKDIAILVRANAHAEAFSRALSRHGIPYQFLGPGRLFKQPEIKDLIAYLNFLNDLNDSVSLYRVLTMEIWNISTRDMAMITSFARRYNLSLFEVMERIYKEKWEVARPPASSPAGEVGRGSGKINNNIFRKTAYNFLNISDGTKDKIKRIIEMVYRHLKLIPKETAGQILFYFLEDSGLLKKLTDYKNVKDEKKAANISKFFDKLRQFEIDNEEASIQAVGDWLDLTMEVGESPLAADIDWVENNAVNILTVHSSKGLEFPVVFLVNLVCQRFPTTERREQIPIPEPLIKEILPVGDYHLEEERRLFYVGMTRARDLLYLTAADFYGEGKRERKISPFVIETLGEKVIEQLVTKKLGEEKNKQLSIFDWKKSVIEEPLITPLLNYSITYLSYSQIESFKACPLQYKYRYILRIPTLPSAAQSFGSSLHSVLRDFYRGLMLGEKLQEENLLKLLEINWLSEGYASKKHEEVSKEKGKKYLKDYYRFVKDEKFITVKVEEPFSFRLKPDLKIGGRIDRVDQLPNGVIELIDYKTGAKIPNQKDVDNNFQLTVYTLAATDKGIFNRKPEEVKLSLYFFEKNQKISTVRKIDQLKKAKEDILVIAKEMAKSQFLPKVSNLCDFCEYRMLCDAWK